MSCVLIGINTAIYSPSGANSGVGFAVPVDIIRSSVTQIIKFGKIIRPILGISFAPDQSVDQVGNSDLHWLLLQQSYHVLGWCDGILWHQAIRLFGWFLSNDRICKLPLQLQLGVQGILVLDARETGPAGSAGVRGTKRDQNGRLVLGDIITGFNSTRVRSVLPACQLHLRLPSSIFLSEALFEP
jgi:S1-C subfamily serine protease